MCHFGFFHLIKNYAETNLQADEKYISQEASEIYITQPNKVLEELNLRKFE